MFGKINYYMQFDSKTIIKTKRLTLRFMDEKDTHDIFVNINHDKDVLQYFIDKYRENESEMTLDKTIKFCLENNRYLFAIELNDTREVIGMILQCSVASPIFNSSEIGFAIGKKHWNKGYTTEAVQAMIDFLFKEGVHKVIAAHLVGNNASKRVIEKCHMKYEGRRIEEIFYHDQYYDVDYYYLLNE